MISRQQKKIQVTEYRRGQVDGLAQMSTRLVQ